MGNAFSDEFGRPSRAYTSVPLTAESRAATLPGVAQQRTRQQNSKQGAAPNDLSLNTLRDRAFQLIHYKRMQLEQAYAQYQTLWMRRNALKEEAQKPHIVQEARACPSEQSPDMLRLFNEAKSLTIALRKAYSATVQLQSSLAVYEELVQKVEACLRGENDHRLLSDYVKTASAIFEETSEHGNPLDELERITSKVYERISSRADAHEMLSDEVQSLNETEQADSAEVTTQHSQTLSAFMQNIARGASLTEEVAPAPATAPAARAATTARRPSPRRTTPLTESTDDWRAVDEHDYDNAQHAAVMRNVAQRATYAGSDGDDQSAASSDLEPDIVTEQSSDEEDWQADTHDPDHTGLPRVPSQPMITQHPRNTHLSATQPLESNA